MIAINTYNINNIANDDDRMTSSNQMASLGIDLDGWITPTLLIYVCSALLIKLVLTSKQPHR